MEWRNIKRAKYVNDASISVRYSDGKAIATVNWQTLTADNLPSKGGETYEIPNVESTDSRLIRLPTGTQGEYDFYLVLTASPQVDISEFPAFPQFAWDHELGELSQIP